MPGSVKSIASLLAAASLVLAACDSAAPAATPTTTFAPLVTSSLAEAPTTSSTTTLAPTTTTTTTIPEPTCDSAVPEGTDAAGFYTEHCDALGIPVIAAADVAKGAVAAAAERVIRMLLPRPDLAEAVRTAGIKVVVIGADAAITALPEFENLYRQYPGTDWRRLGRSFSGTNEITVAAGAEENLLCDEDDPYEGEDMLIREFAHTIRRFGLASIDPVTNGAIERAYGRAIATGLWSDTLAEVNSDQYWAEGAQSYFDVNNEADPTDRRHNHVDTRQELRQYDPQLHDLLQSVFGDSEWRPFCA